MNPSTPWQANEEFLALSRSIDGKTLLTEDRRYVIYTAAKYAVKLGGNAAEVGVYQGGIAYIVGSLYKGRKVYLFDTFTGLPDVDPSQDLHSKGDFFDTSLQRVAELCRAPEFVIKQGLFPGTANGLNTEFSFVHLDADLYQSTKDGLEFFWPRMVKGGIIILDDFHWVSCPGVAAALSQFSKDTGAIPIELPNCTAMLIK